MTNEKTGSVIILSGPVGAGKTTVSKELIKSAPEPLAYIEGDKFWFFIVKGAEAMGKSKNFRTIMASMIAASIPYATAGYEVIIDFSLPPWFLETAIKILSRRELSLEYIVIKPGEDLCASRAANREEGVISDYSTLHEFYLSFEEAKKYTISDDTASPSLIAERIREGLARGLFHVYPQMTGRMNS